MYRGEGAVRAAMGKMVECSGQCKPVQKACVGKAWEGIGSNAVYTPPAALCKACWGTGGRAKFRVVCKTGSFARPAEHPHNPG